MSNGDYELKSPIESRGPTDRECPKPQRECPKPHAPRVKLLMGSDDKYFPKLVPPDFFESLMQRFIKVDLWLKDAQGALRDRNERRERLIDEFRKDVERQVEPLREFIAELEPKIALGTSIFKGTSPTDSRFKFSPQVSETNRALIDEAHQKILGIKERSARQEKQFKNQCVFNDKIDLDKIAAAQALLNEIGPALIPSLHKRFEEKDTKEPKEISLHPLGEIPHEFMCPISREIMTDPVITSDGLSWEKQQIETWLADHDTSPLTNVVLESKKTIPNTFLKNLINDFYVRRRLGLPTPLSVE